MIGYNQIFRRECLQKPTSFEWIFTQDLAYMAIYSIRNDIFNILDQQKPISRIQKRIRNGRDDHIIFLSKPYSDFCSTLKTILLICGYTKEWRHQFYWGIIHLLFWKGNTKPNEFIFTETFFSAPELVFYVHDYEVRYAGEKSAVRTLLKENNLKSLCKHHISFTRKDILHGFRNCEFSIKIKIDHHKCKQACLSLLIHRFWIFSRIYEHEDETYASNLKAKRKFSHLISMPLFFVNMIKPVHKNTWAELMDWFKYKDGSSQKITDPLVPIPAKLDKTRKRPRV